MFSMAPAGESTLKQSVFETSCHDTAHGKDKHLNFFKDVDPDIEYVTVFDVKFAKPEGESAIIDLPNTEQEIIELEIAKVFMESPKKIWDWSPKDGMCHTVNQLHNPKGFKQICELCPKGATLTCSKCTVTFYCSWEHWRRDRSHNLVCDKIKMIRWPTPHRNSSLDRRRQVAQKMLVMEMLLDDLIYQSFLYLSKKQYRHSLGTLLQCFKYVIPVYSWEHGSSQMITLYSAMTEVYIGLRKLNFAKKMMLNALSVLWRDKDRGDHKDESKMNYINALLRKTRGEYYYATSKYTKALSCFSEYVIYLTEAAGASHIRLCMGFYLLGKTFVALRMDDKGRAIITFCVDMWLYYLVNRMSVVAPDIPSLPNTIYFKQKYGVTITRFVKLDFIRFFGDIWTFINEEDHPTDTVKLHLCEAMMLFLEKKYRLTLEHLEKCSDLFLHKVKDLKLHALWKHMTKLYGRRVKLGSLARD